MRKTRLAELLLALVTSQDRAVSMVGDLLEEDDALTPWRFWLFVIRTAVSQLWRQMASAPFGMSRAAILGIGLELGWLTLAMMIAMLPTIAISEALLHKFPPHWAAQWLPYAVANLLVPIRIGFWMSRRYRGREAVGILTLALFHATVNLFAGWLCWQLARAGGRMNIHITVFGPLIVWDSSILATLARVAYYLTLYPMLSLAGAASAHARSRT